MLEKKGQKNYGVEEVTVALFSGYASRYRDLAFEIKQAVPDAVVTGRTGRPSSFEVTLNGKLIYSKLQTHGFPDTKEVVMAIQKGSSGKEVAMVQKKEKSCVVQ
ncbi:hypothetical protein AALO_G00194770 [Alosa alosa]|uniref:Selenoprotein W n=1 Tax=Alosa alosa TaxID=278164 RepID=A0AAV6GCX7_9TELE|nr:hypothetical protein AALO_G00194770 [Alosa alosa]